MDGVGFVGAGDAEHDDVNEQASAFFPLGFAARLAGETRLAQPVPSQGS